MRLQMMACTYYALCIKCTKTFAGISEIIKAPPLQGASLRFPSVCRVSMWACMGVGASVGVSYKLVGIFKTKPLTQLVSALCSLYMMTISKTHQIMGAL